MAFIPPTMKFDFEQSSESQDTISDEKLSSGPVETLRIPLRIYLQQCQGLENYEAVPDTRVIAKRARKSYPSRSVGARKISIQNQESISQTKAMNHTICEHKYRDNLWDRFDELLRVLPVQHKSEMRGNSGPKTPDRRMKRCTLLDQAKAYIDSLETNQQILEKEQRYLRSREQYYIRAFWSFGTEAEDWQRVEDTTV